MSRRGRMVRNAAIGLAALISVLSIAAIVTVRTDWFREYVRRKIIEAAETGTGGKVEVGSFSFRLRTLEAVVTDFVIHGKEPPGAAPYVRVARLQVNVRPFASIRRVLDVSYLEVEKPEINILVFPDGTTNVPEPKKPHPDTTALDSLIDLAADRFQISNGALSFQSRKQPIDVRGSNLRVGLSFSTLTRTYSGDISLQPLYIVSGRNTPVVFTVHLPVTLERKKIVFENARVTTAASALTINGSLEDLKDPKPAARINGHIALSDLKKLGDFPGEWGGQNLPEAISVDGNAAMSGARITVNGMRLGLGQSNIEASGTLKDPEGKGALEFRATVSLDEFGRIARLKARPGGLVVANGKASLDGANNYRVTGEVDGRRVAFSQGDRRFRDVNVHAAVDLNPRRLELRGLRLSAFGGQFTGEAILHEFARYSVRGSLQNFNVQTMSRVLGKEPLPYGGTVSGPVTAQGSIEASERKVATAAATLNIAPGRGGIPVSGRVEARYEGQSDDITLNDSFVALPNTRVNLSGSLRRRLNVDATSRNLNDLFAAGGPREPPLKLEGGQARLTGYVTGSLTKPQITAHLTMGRFSAQGRLFDSASADVTAAANRVDVRNGLVRRGSMQAQIAGATGLANWSPAENQPVRVAASIQNGDLADVMALAGQPPAGYAGALSLNANIGGTMGNPIGTADVQVLKGSVRDEPFDQIQARVTMSDQRIAIPAASITAGPSRVNLTAEYQHSRDSLMTGRLQVRVESNQIDLGRVRTLQRERPNSGGVVALNMEVAANLKRVVGEAVDQTEFQVTALNGQASARGLRFEGENYGDATVSASTAGQAVRYDLVSNFAGSEIKVTGNTELASGYKTTADANLRNLPVERLLVLARRTEIPVRGMLSGTAHASGTLEEFQGKVDLDLAKAIVYDEPLDRVRVTATYLPQQIDVSLFEAVSGPSRVELTAKFSHPANDRRSGEVEFRVNSSRIELARLRNVEKWRPGLSGVLQFSGEGAATIQPKTSRVLLRGLKADASVNGIAARGQNFGDLTFKATTTAGRLQFTLDSNLANANITGRGTAELSADYPVDAQLSFQNVAWSRLQPLVAPDGAGAAFEAVTEGQISFKGSISRPDQISGSLRLPRLEITPVARRGVQEKSFTLRNEGPIAATIDRGVVRVGSARLTGPQTDISATGTVTLAGTRRASLNIAASTDIGVLQTLSRDIYSSGKVAVEAKISGPLAKPAVDGKLDLQNASFHHLSLPNGLSNGNGTIVFSGNTATIRNLTGESGGGEVTLSGFVAYSDGIRLGIRATATEVRVRTQQGASVVATGTVNMTGTSESSVAAGEVTINRISYSPQSDFGSILTRAAPPIQAAGAPEPFLANMRLDIRVRTSSATAVQASLAQNIQLDADLRVRGTAATPGVLGRLRITRGDVVFFGSKYRISRGTIGFYNPVRIEPQLNITLETQAKGVNVVLTVTGPIDNMRLTYSSEPPLQFQEIVALLASGRTPTSDPTLLANQPSQPDQSFQQMGESALVSKAIADPVASRLQRVFGVSQLKIDPAFTSGSDLPQARVTLQQQITSNLTFTYVTALENANTQIIRIEWTFSPRWSAVANRDENGIVSVNFLYKKRFR